MWMTGDEDLAWRGEYGKAMDDESGECNESVGSVESGQNAARGHTQAQGWGQPQEAMTPDERHGMHLQSDERNVRG